MTDTTATIKHKNNHFGLDMSESKVMYGRTLYRVVALATLTLISGYTVQEGAKGGWCSEQSVVEDRVAWLPEGVTFWGGTFRGGTFWGGTLLGGTFWGGTF